MKKGGREGYWVAEPERTQKGEGEKPGGTVEEGLSEGVCTGRGNNKYMEIHGVKEGFMKTNVWLDKY